VLERVGDHLRLGRGRCRPARLPRRPGGGLAVVQHLAGQRRLLALEEMRLGLRDPLDGALRVVAVLDVVEVTFRTRRQGREVELRGGGTSRSRQRARPRGGSSSSGASRPPAARFSAARARLRSRSSSGRPAASRSSICALRSLRRFSSRGALGGFLGLRVGLLEPLVRDALVLGLSVVSSPRLSSRRQWWWSSVMLLPPTPGNGGEPMGAY
jgi:hypothetical protein